MNRENFYNNKVVIDVTQEQVEKYFENFRELEKTNRKKEEETQLDFDKVPIKQKFLFKKLDLQNKAIKKNKEEAQIQNSIINGISKKIGREQKDSIMNKSESYRVQRELKKECEEEYEKLKDNKWLNSLRKEDFVEKKETNIYEYIRNPTNNHHSRNYLQKIRNHPMKSIFLHNKKYCSNSMDTARKVLNQSKISRNYEDLSIYGQRVIDKEEEIAGSFKRKKVYVDYISNPGIIGEEVDNEGDLIFCEKGSN